MKELGSTDGGGKILELDGREYEALVTLVGAIGDNRYYRQPGEPLPDTPITDWLLAVKVFVREIEALKQAKESIDKVLRQLTPEDVK